MRASECGEFIGFALRTWKRFETERCEVCLLTRTRDDRRGERSGCGCGFGAEVGVAENGDGPRFTRMGFAQQVASTRDVAQREAFGDEVIVVVEQCRER